jgi:LPXTG-motif cell wall-anchored protein
MRSFVALAGLVTLLTVALGGPASAATASVSMVDFNFSPATVTIQVGDTVVWTNNGAQPHTSTSDSGIWDSGIVNAGGSFSRTFSSAGSFPYHCNVHPIMTGTVVVQAGGTGGTGGLPSTGASDSIVPFIWIGALFLFSGAVVLFVMRRRRA